MLGRNNEVFKEAKLKPEEEGAIFGYIVRLDFHLCCFTVKFNSLTKRLPRGSN